MSYSVNEFGDKSDFEESRDANQSLLEMTSLFISCKNSWIRGLHDDSMSAQIKMKKVADQEIGAAASD
jgi:hypothetical protein